MNRDDESYPEFSEMTDDAERAKGQRLAEEILAQARAVRAPAGLKAQGMARIRNLPPPSPRALDVWRAVLTTNPMAWRSRPVMWAPILATMLLCSLLINGWLGYRALRQLSTSSPSHTRLLATRELLIGPATADDPLFNSYLFQIGIRRQHDLGALAAAHPALESRAATLGFVSGSEFYVMGSLYAEALAYLRSDDTETAAKRLASIYAELRRLNVPAPISQYVSDIRHALNRSWAQAASLRYELALFQPLCEAYARSQGHKPLIMFRLGAWLVDVRLTAAAGDKHLLRQADKTRYFARELKRLSAPKKVLEALDQLGTVVMKAEMREHDVQETLQLVQKMQRLLG